MFNVLYIINSFITEADRKTLSHFLWDEWNKIHWLEQHSVKFYLTISDIRPQESVHMSMQWANVAKPSCGVTRWHQVQWKLAVETYLRGKFSRNILKMVFKLISDKLQTQEELSLQDKPWCKDHLSGLDPATPWRRTCDNGTKFKILMVICTVYSIP